MSFINDFPYTDFHELNLDWCLNKVKELTDEFLNLKKQNEKVLSDFEILQNNFSELKKYVLNAFTDDNIKQIISTYLATMIFVEITESGYIIYNIPESWNDIIFNTTELDIVVESQKEYGHLVLSY